MLKSKCCCWRCIWPSSKVSANIGSELKPSRPGSSAHQRRQTGYLAAFFLEEDNARFGLLALMLLIYMLIGAGIFELIESGKENEEKSDFESSYKDVLNKVNESIVNSNVTMEQIEELLYLWGNATDSGQNSVRRHWDYYGSFHFVYTIVSTIGYGYSAPRTAGGRIFCIFYGLFGCSSGILFFNLFLERIITLLAYVMRARHEQRLRKMQAHLRRASQESIEEDNLDHWKPSVYWVLFYLGIASTIVITTAASMFMKLERWSYLEGLYFSFISFATIGFGDFVSAQQENAFYGPGIYAYRFGTFFFLVLGCCCIYSLFNVISIVVKQLLNVIIKRIAIFITTGKCGTPPSQRIGAIQALLLRSNIMGDIVDEAERKLSGEMVSMREMLEPNKVSLAMMQKHLYETAQMARATSANSQKLNQDKDGFTPGQVGPLAIASNALGKG